MDVEPPSASRKRPRDNESPSQRQKREKAAERQRRKRERDRVGNNSVPPTPQPIDFAPPPQDIANPYHPGPDYLSAPPPPPPPPDDSLTTEEQARRERVRAAARERQRKHRALVKQRKMRELGLDMGNDIMSSGIEDPAQQVHYRVDQDGQYQQVLPAELAHLHQAQAAAAAAAQGGPPPQGEPPFPTGPVHGGQTFATTLLLSFSCAPLLKQHLLRTLNMTNDELASLEPVIAEAWDRWDQGRRAGIRYDHPPPPEGYPAGAPYPYPPGAVPPPPGAVPPAGAEDFRARFQRVVGMQPFTYAAGAPEGAAFANGAPAEGAAETASTGTAAEVNGAGGAVEGIDPHLGVKEEGEKTDS